jgi:hypothetical protein
MLKMVSKLVSKLPLLQMNFSTIQTVTTVTSPLVKGYHAQCPGIFTHALIIDHLPPYNGKTVIHDRKYSQKPLTRLKKKRFFNFSSTTFRQLNYKEAKAIRSKF